jgi:hypothetical protein
MVEMRGPALLQPCALLQLLPLGAGQPRLLFPDTSKADSHLCIQVRKEAEAADSRPSPQGSRLLYLAPSTCYRSCCRQGASPATP